MPTPTSTASEAQDVASRLRWVLAGWTRTSFVAIGLVVVGYAAVAWHWRHLLRPELGMDWLLAAIWAFMTLLLAWRIQLRRDLALVFIGLCGGAVIEWWGTTTNLWHYFTAERPPVWILPAWPVAALTIHRLPALVGSFWSRVRALGALYWFVLPGFVLLMTRFGWASAHLPSSQVVLVIMVGVTAVGAKPDRDMAIFLSGALLGFFLEYWGTSRLVWVYWTRETPPLEAVLAHGFAAVAFGRAEQAGALLVRTLRNGRIS